MIDKTNFIIKEKNVEDFKYLLRKKNKSYKHEYLDTTLTLRLGNGIQAIINYHNNSISRILTNPSAYHSYYDYIDNLIQVFSIEELSKAPIFRLDLAADYYKHWEKIFLGIDIKYKRYIDVFEIKNKEVTGLVCGTNNKHQIVVYNKLKEIERKKSALRKASRLQNFPGFISVKNSGWVRVEERFYRQRNVPIKSVFDLKNLLLMLQDDPSIFFRNTNVYDLSLVDVQSVRKSHQAKWFQLKHYLNLKGYSVTKRLLNQNQNFSRDYAPLIIKKLIKPTPQEVLKENLIQFFGINGEENEK